MVNYGNGKIYTIRSYSRPDLIYVGATVQLLKERLRLHKKAYKRYIEGKYNYMTSFKIIELDDTYIELYAKCPCNDKEELHKREGEVIRELDCVNRCVAGRTLKEYREENKEKIAEYQKEYRDENKDAIAEKAKQYREENKEVIKEYKKQYYEENKQEVLEKAKQYQQENKEAISEYHKQYREENKEKIAEKKKQKYTCECGERYTHSNKARHFKTKKHKNFINSNIEASNAFTSQSN